MSEELQTLLLRVATLADVHRNAQRTFNERDVARSIKACTDAGKKLDEALEQAPLQFVEDSKL